jgi:hypothetical protein
MSKSSRPPKPKPEPDREAADAAERERRRQRLAKGRASTLLTSQTGPATRPNVGAATLGGA